MLAVGTTRVALDVDRRRRRCRRARGAHRGARAGTTALPLGALRVVVGGLLLIFGLQWLRKAILRASGLQGAPRRGTRYSRASAHAARGAGRGRRRVRSVLVHVSFKGVFLEGLEVVFIVLTFGANQHASPLAAAAAGAAVAARHACRRGGPRAAGPRPENTMKFAVGVMLTSFGMFWGAEGAGAHWPGGDAALLVVVPSVLVCGLGSGRDPAPARRAARVERSRRSGAMSRIAALGRFLWDFVVGDDWRIAAGVVSRSPSGDRRRSRGGAWWILPPALVGLLAWSCGARGAVDWRCRESSGWRSRGGLVDRGGRVGGWFWEWSRVRGPRQAPKGRTDGG